jgi:FkbH-like protein
MLPLAALRLDVNLTVRSGLYGQYEQDLVDAGSDLYTGRPDVIVVAVDEGAVRLPGYSESPRADVEAEATRWRRLWENAERNSTATVVQHNFAVRPESPFGHLSRGLEGSRFAMLQALNTALAESATDSVSIVDCDRLAADFGRARWFDDRYWIRSKQAVALEAVPLLARHTAAVIAARLGLSRKCLVLDLDGTLWGGVIGDDGLAGIQLGGDGIGEAFVAFQETVLRLKDRGVLLAIASKNNEADAREAFERHPDMRIRLEDISAFAVNWEDKPANLRRIAHALDLGVEALVLVDDNPAERQLVRQLVPEVDVISLPPEPAQYRRALADYLGFEPATITTEDWRRTQQYRARTVEAELASSATDIAAFYRDLRMRATTAPFDEQHMRRIAQLVGKTNQFNLTTCRHSIAELNAFCRSKSHVTRYLRLSDRFTDHGLVGVAIAEIAGDTLDIDTFLMSCRVIGRTAEDHLLAQLCGDAGRAGCSVLRGTYIPTNKNSIVSGLYERFGFGLVKRESDGRTCWEYDLAASGPIASEFIEELDPTEHD